MSEQFTNMLWDMYCEFRRLKGYPKPSTAPINKLIDAHTGMEEKILEEFAEWLVNDILPRMPKVEGYQKDEPPKYGGVYGK